MVCHSLLQLTTFCQNSPPWLIHLGWLYMACLSFLELVKAVVHVIRLISFLWLWFLSVCPLMPSLHINRLTGISLTLDVGYLFKAAPAKHSHCSLGWMCGISSWPLLLTICVCVCVCVCKVSHQDSPISYLIFTKYVWVASIAFYREADYGTTCD